VTGWKCLALDVVGPRAPDPERVAVQILEIVPACPEDEDGTADAASGGAVGLVERLSIVAFAR
jgi:hypothetical protein